MEVAGDTIATFDISDSFSQPADSFYLNPKALPERCDCFVPAGLCISVASKEYQYQLFYAKREMQRNQTRLQLKPFARFLEE